MIINDLGAKFPEQSSRIAIESSSQITNDDEGLSQCGLLHPRRQIRGGNALEPSRGKREREKKREIVTYVSHRANLVHNM